MMNDRFIWATKHWGVGIGGCMVIAGLVLAAPENMNTWRQVERSSQFLGQTYTETTYLRQGENLTSGYQVVGITFGKHETKTLGTGLLFLGSVMVWGFAQALVPEYDRLERTNHKIRQSEFELEDVEIQQNTEVSRWAIEIDAQSDISNMLNPPKAYLQDEEDEEAEERKALAGGGGTKFSETYTGFLGWLNSKEIKQATVRDLAQKSFNGKKIPSEQIRKWVDELCVDELAQWLDEDKKEFRLLNQ